MEQDITHWNSKESIRDYVEIKAYLFDSEKVLLQQATENLDKNVNDIKILDLGCGGGRTTSILHNMGYDVIGIDIAENLIKNLQKKFPKLKAEVGNAAGLKYKAKSFDIVLFSHNSIDYLFPETERLKALKEIHRVLKSNGFLIFSSHHFRFLPYNYPVFTNLLRNISRLTHLRKKGYYQERMSNGKLVETYAITQKEMRKQLKQAGFICIRSTLINHQEENFLMTSLKSWLSWERYYLAQKE